MRHREGRCMRHKRHRFDPWVGKIPLNGKWQPAPVFSPGKFHGQQSLVGYSPRGRKELNTTERTHTSLKHPEPQMKRKEPQTGEGASSGPSRQQVEECGRLFLQLSSRDSKQLSHCYHEQWLYNAKSCVINVPLTEHPPCARSSSSFFTSIIYSSGKLIFMEY